MILLYISITIYTYFHLQIFGWGKEKVIKQFHSCPAPTISLFPAPHPHFEPHQYRLKSGKSTKITAIKNYKQSLIIPYSFD